MQKIGQRLVWEEKEGSGVPTRVISLQEYSDEEIEDFIKTNTKPEGSMLIFFAKFDSIRYLYEEFVPRDDDVYICTYAKSGTTWMQQIVYQLFFGPTEDFEDLTIESPWLETEFGQTFIPSLSKSPRILKTHLRFEHLPKNIKGKIIFIDRYICDVLASYKRHVHGFGVNISEEALTDMFINHKLSLGPYADYIKSWKNIAPGKLGDNLLSLSYEEIRKDSNLIQTIAKFLNIELSDEKLKEVQRLSGIEYMRGNSKFNHGTERVHSLKVRNQESSTNKSEFSFVGQGIVGGYSSSLSPKSIELVKQYAQKHGL